MTSHRYVFAACGVCAVVVCSHAAALHCLSLGLHLCRDALGNLVSLLGCVYHFRMFAFKFSLLKT
ncbi:hypothetical protein LOK49_LG12G01830 [Camellia lanceoleosa]|uniref:Uncharacterized protein n=1 Tax=Camellia lanceoleosa TaxID=1840588 RepID=A0ACC0FW05_9ERIC|nr:hypothetical protein LOK49_LG12G01830 [Camellia lanceoleosa]